MKLRRLISVLIIFTLIMASAVCVSANPASKVYTVYGTDGNASIKATVSADPGVMVSYIVYGSESDNTLSEKNITYIDQQTVLAGQTKVEFPLVTGALSAIEGRLVRFGSSAGTVSSTVNNVGDSLSTTKWIKVDDITANTTDKSITVKLTVNDTIVGSGYSKYAAGIDMKLTNAGNTITFEDLDILAVDSDNKCAVVVKFTQTNDSDKNALETYFTSSSTTIEINPYVGNTVDGNKTEMFNNIVDGYWVAK